MTAPTRNPILLDLPMPITTPRLVIRPPQPGEGPMCNTAIRESFKELHQWMIWARAIPSVDETEIFVRQAASNWILRKELVLWIWDRENGEFVGGTGFHDIDWAIPKAEIGYWIRTSASGKGVMTEAVQALSKFAFKVMHAKRIEIRCDDMNLKSAAVAERAGYSLEGVLKHNELRPDGTLRDTRVYSKLSA